MEYNIFWVIHYSIQYNMCDPYKTQILAKGSLLFEIFFQTKLFICVWYLQRLHSEAGAYEQHRRTVLYLCCFTAGC